MKKISTILLAVSMIFTQISTAYAYQKSEVFEEVIEYKANEAKTINLTNGYITMSREESGEFSNGDMIVITANPPIGTRFVKWVCVDPEVKFAKDTSMITTLTMPNSDVEIIALCMDNTEYSVNVSGGSTFSQKYLQGETVILSATSPEPGKVFDKFTTTSKGVVFEDATNSQTSFKMIGSNVDIVANFKDIEYNVKVSNGKTTSDNFTTGNVVTVVADQAPYGYKFKNWTSDNTSVQFINTIAPITTFTMPSENVTINANYELETKSEKTGNTLVVNGGSSFDTKFEQGEVVFIYANSPQNGKVFSHWTVSGDAKLINAYAQNTTFAMQNSDVTVTANYVDAKYTVKTNECVVNSVENLSGEVITITADVAPVGKQFSHWSSNSGVAFSDVIQETTTFVMPSQNVEITANYVDTKYNVSVLDGKADNSTFVQGQSVTIIANKAHDGEEFSHWTGNVTLDNDKSPVVVFEMPSEDVMLFAQYEQIAEVIAPKYDVNIVGGSGSGSYEENELVYLSADTAISGTKFEKWTSNENVEFENEFDENTKFTMISKDVSITANYEDIVYSLEIIGGTTDKNSYKADEQVIITANSAEIGKEFKGWISSTNVVFANNTSETTTFAMPSENVTITANYDDIIYINTINNGFADKQKALSGETIEITANQAEEGKEFVNWTAEGVELFDENSKTTTFVMPLSNTEITANYKDILYNPTITDGLASKTDYIFGETVEIIANKAPEGKIFKNWTITGSTLVDSSLQTTSFVMPSTPVTIVANYEYTEQELTLTNAKSSKSSFIPGEMVTVTAVAPQDGLKFVKWTGNISVSNSQTVTFTMPTEAVFLTAEFESEEYPITVVNGSTNTENAKKGETITITANNPEEGKKFKGWVSDTNLKNSSSQTTTFTMPANHVRVVADYENINYTVKLSNATSEKTTYNFGDTVTIKAESAKNGQKFIGWTNDAGLVLQPNAETSFVMPSKNVTISANYADETYDIKVENGTSNVSASKKGETVTITANSPAENMEFVGFTTKDGVTFKNANSQTTTFTMPDYSVTITANYKEKEVAKTRKVTTINATTAQEMYEVGANVTVTANSPAEGYKFVGWTSNVDVSNATITSFIMPDADVSITANYELIPVISTYNVEVRNGSGSAEYKAGDVVNITANPSATNMVFSKWSSASGVAFENENLQTTSFIMPAYDVSVTADYSLVELKYNLTVNNGTGTGAYTDGTNITLVANTPAEGTKFVNWTSNSAISFSDNTSATTIITMPEEDVIITANYETIPVVQTDINNLKVVNGYGSGAYTFGEKVVITCERAPEGTTFKGWVADKNINFSTTVHMTTTFAMPKENVTVTAVFEYADGSYYGEVLKYNPEDKTVTTVTPNTSSPSTTTPNVTTPSTTTPNVTTPSTSTGSVTINATASGMGSISPAGSNSYNTGSSQTFTISPENGYYVSDVLVNGKSVGAILNYTVSNVQANTTISAIFSKREVISSSATVNFSDVEKGSTYYTTIVEVVNRGLMFGNSQTTFNPNGTMQIGDLMTSLYNLENKPSIIANPYFGDVSVSDSNIFGLSFAYEKGIYKGVQNGNMQPSKSITRKEFAIIMYDYFNYKKVDFTKYNMFLPYKDQTLMTRDELDKIGIVTGMGIIGAKANYQFSPNDYITRAEVAQALSQAIKVIDYN